MWRRLQQYSGEKNHLWKFHMPLEGVSVIKGTDLCIGFSHFCLPLCHTDEHYWAYRKQIQGHRCKQKSDTKMVSLVLLKPEGKLFRKVLWCKHCCICTANFRQLNFHIKTIFIFRKSLEFVLPEENVSLCTAYQLGHFKTETLQNCWSLLKFVYRWLGAGAVEVSTVRGPDPKQSMMTP